ncbi:MULTISPECIES: ribonuclease P protein component [Nocardioides]|uniref:Ribonuclease P protein component n=1 Tax=Nocardioides vastitatis TaxID=2568655 RepID=A0ABW0ZL56_9ACTN|nr:ribonuclease P protein component [Nocardioides sp.]THI96750.1 ribonuclease P protein component [Nocardioides sp.]
MLPGPHRLTDPDAFRAASRQGRRAGSPTVVTHLLLPLEQQVLGTSGSGTTPARAGFVVSKAVGSSVVRNRVKRRLRHVVRGRVGALPPGALLVVRAQSASAEASYADLAADLDRCLARVTGGTEEAS